MTSRFRLALVFSSVLLAGCADVFGPAPPQYAVNEKILTDLKDKPKLQLAVRQTLAELFGPTPQEIKVPVGMGLPAGGRRLAGWVQEGAGNSLTRKPVRGPRIDADTWTYLKDPRTGRDEDVVYEGGYTLYRRHCLHCHGVSGDGAGPTADFLYPRPRDYRKGIFKFTSTTTEKPTRADLVKTIRYGLHGTSMPAFDSLMTPEEIEQVTDYVIFLSTRGEVELGLLELASIADETQEKPLAEADVKDVVDVVFNKWKNTDTQVLDPPMKRPVATAESIARGRELFLGRDPGKKGDCWQCHGPQAEGNGTSFIDQRIFYRVVFDQEPLDQAVRAVYNLDHASAEGHGHGGAAPAGSAATASDFEHYLKTNQDLWKQSIDDWGFPLRPANLNLGVYKGGRRPIDIYWRIAKGINGAKMPGHASSFTPEQMWDLVNFVLALPYEQELLRGATPPSAAPAQAPAVAQRLEREGR